MVLTSALLWPIVPIAAARVAGLVVGLPFLLGFVRDYSVASGHLSPASPGYLRWRRRLKRILKTWVPPVLRGLVLLACMLVARWVPADPGASTAGRWLILACGLLAMLLVLGVAGRLAALGVTILSAFAMVWVGTQPQLLLLMGASLALLLTGTGPGSLWRGDTFLVDWRPGASHRGQG
jgi:hypothetical protein